MLISYWSSDVCSSDLNIERRIVGHVTGIAAAFGNYAADGGVDRIDLQTLRGLDAGEKLAAPDGVADLLGDRHDTARKLAADFRSGRRIEFDRAIKLACIADGGGPGLGDFTPALLGCLRGHGRATLVIFVGAAAAFAFDCRP